MSKADSAPRPAAGSTAAARSASPSTASATRARRRHPGLGAARQRHPSGRPQLQVPPAARHPLRRRRKSRTRWSSSSAATGTEPNLRATADRDLRRSRRPPARTAGRTSKFDVGAINDVLSQIFVAGFYYKTFMWPQSFWMTVYEPVIRRAAGLGKAPAEPDPDRYDNDAHPLRRAGGRRRPRRPGGRTAPPRSTRRPRRSWPTSRPSSAAPALQRDADHRRQAGLRLGAATRSTS